MSLFGTDGIRGRAGEGPLAPERVRLLGRAIGRLLKKNPTLVHAEVPPWFSRRHPPASRGAFGTGKILIGRDTRLSGPSIEQQLTAGLMAEGCSVLTVGVLTTPGVSQLTRRWGCSLGIVVSASHNPAEDNGIKLLSPEGLKVPDKMETAVEALCAGIQASDKTLPGATCENVADRISDYTKALRKSAGPDLSLQGMKIVVDCAHGAASAIAPELLRELGAETTILAAHPDGRNINDGVGAVHPGVAAEEVRRGHADLGVAFDGDADRAILVDETGSIVDGDFLLAMHAIDLLQQHELPHRTVVSTIMANQGLEKALSRHEIRLIRVKVGDRFVSEEMLRSGARLGGEQSGHMIFADAAPAGDGILTLLKTLALLRRTNRRLSELASAMTKYPQVLLNVPVLSQPPLEKIAPVQEALREVEQQLQGDGRVVLRYSGTEPLCRVMVEGPDEIRTRQAAERIATAVHRALGKT